MVQLDTPSGPFMGVQSNVLTIQQGINYTVRHASDPHTTELMISRLHWSPVSSPYAVPSKSFQGPAMSSIKLCASCRIDPVAAHVCPHGSEHVGIACQALLHTRTRIAQHPG